MKKIILSALLLTSISLIAQDFNRQDFAYKQFSPYWRIVKTETGTNTMIPFQPLDLFNTYYKDNIDTTKVKELVYEAFNEFRKDYGVSTCIKSINLHEYAQQWAYDIKQNGFRHSKSNGIWSAECCTSVSAIQYTCIRKEQGDINQIVARSLLDNFAYSKSHMDLLTSNKFTEAGIGVVFYKNDIWIVVQLN